MDTELKTCSRCLIAQPVTAFSPQGRYGGLRGRRALCKTCSNKSGAAYREKVKKVRLAYQAGKDEMPAGDACLPLVQSDSLRLDDGDVALVEGKCDSQASTVVPAANSSSCACPKRTICTHCGGMTEGKASECRFCHCRLKLRVYKSHQAGCARLARFIDGWPAQSGDAITSNHAGASRNRRHAGAS